MNKGNSAHSELTDRPVSPLMAMARLIGSLRIAVFLIVVLTALLVCSTFYESIKSTELAQRFIYSSWWFDFYITLFAANVFFAVVTRYPWKKKHVGFIITHAGIITICVGAAIDRHFGVEGQMYLMEGDALDTITLSEKVLEISVPSRNLSFRAPADLSRVRSRLGKPIPLGKSDYALTFVDLEPNMSLERKVTESGGGERNPALLFELKSETAGFSEKHWLVYHDENDPESNIWALGPATFKLFKAVSADEAELLLKPVQTDAFPDMPHLKITFPGQERPVSIPIQENQNEPFPLEAIDATLHIKDYFPSARVVENNLVNEPEASANPAVQFELIRSDGAVERHTAFAFFPEFDTLHGSGEKGWSGIKAILEGGAKTKTDPRVDFIFVQDADGSLRYSAETGSGEYQSGAVALDTWQAAGWMDFQFSVKQYFVSAKVEQEAVPLSKNGGNEGKRESLPGLKLLFSKNDAQTGQELISDTKWVLFGNAEFFLLDSEEVFVSFSYRSEPVPFSLKLVDFRRTFYPGTSTPASYESDVVLHDHTEGLTREQKIYMNHPLDYKGYRAFQSSFVEVPPGEPEISVFQVAKAPGTPVIYGGAIIMILGIIVMFYIKKFSNPFPV